MTDVPISGDSWNAGPVEYHRPTVEDFQQPAQPAPDLYWAGPVGVDLGEEIELTPAEQTRGRLWVTTDLRYARLIAHLGDRGTVYRVTPVAGAVTTVERAGDVEPTWEVQGLRVDAVIAARVKLGKGWLRKYGAAWLAAGGRPSPAVSRLRIRRVTAGPGLKPRAEIDAGMWP